MDVSNDCDVSLKLQEVRLVLCRNSRLLMRLVTLRTISTTSCLFIIPSLYK